MTDAKTEWVAKAGEPVTLADCPVGLFVDEYGGLCTKTEYGNNDGRIDAYIVESGEFFWGAAPQTIATQRMQIVRPVAIVAASPTLPPIGDGDGDLVERLQKLGEWLDFDFGRDDPPAGDIAREAAAEVERLKRTAGEDTDLTDKATAWDAIAEKNATISTLSRQLEEAREATETERFPKTLGLIHAAIDGYVSALVNREHGGIALSRAFEKICGALDRQPTQEMDARRAKETVSHG